MWSWLRRRKKIDRPLIGAPAVRRQKTYSAHSGFVYQYFYEGHRPGGRGRAAGTEYVFAVSADRTTSFPVSVFIEDSAVRSWEASHSRGLTSTERYAIAKMALFQAFDERPTPARMREQVRVSPADVEAILTALGLD